MGKTLEQFEAAMATIERFDVQDEIQLWRSKLKPG
jgi:hypothetical protein